MTLTFWLIAAVFWVYFHLMSVRPVGDGAVATESRLTRPFLFQGDVLRAAVAATPISVLHAGNPLGHAFMAWLALFLLIEPLLIPTSLEPEAEDIRPIARFAGKWIAAELDRGIKTALIVGAPLLLARWIPWLGWLGSSHMLEEHFTFIERRPDGLDLPLAIYLAFLMMLLVKVCMLLGLPSNGLRAAFGGWLAGCVVLIYFFNIAGQLQLSEHEWEFPAGAFTASMGLKFLVSYFWARADAAAKGTGIR